MAEATYDPNRVYDLPMTEILADNRFNCRGVIDPTEVMEMAKDIKQRGLDFPVIVQPWSIPGKPAIKYRLVAGYRRYTAHTLIFAESIRCMIREGLDEVEARILNLRENTQRTQLNVMQEARAIEHLVDAGLTQEEIGRRIGKSRGWVQERVYLLELPDEIQAEAAAGTLSLKDVRKIWSLPSTQQQFEYVRRLKESREDKQKREPKVESVRRHNEKRVRSLMEIQDMQDVIREQFGNNMATRALGWVIAALSDLEMHQYFAEVKRESGQFYAIPEGLEGPARITAPTAGIPIDGQLKETDDSGPIGLPWKDASEFDDDDDSDLIGLDKPDPEDERRGQSSAPVSG